MMRAALVRSAMTEAQLQSLILAACKAFGHHCYHTHDSRRSQAGFPDLVIVGRHRGMFREEKTDTGLLTPAQAGWLAALRQAGFDADVWRPADWRSGRITAELAALRRPAI